MLTSTINCKEKAKEPKPFPKMMQFKDEEFIILATKQDGRHIVGTVVKTKDDSYPLGFYSNTWGGISDDRFHDWEGSVTLTQD